MRHVVQESFLRYLVRKIPHKISHSPQSLLNNRIVVIITTICYHHIPYRKSPLTLAMSYEQYSTLYLEGGPYVRRVAYDLSCITIHTSSLPSKANVCAKTFQTMGQQVFCTYLSLGQRDDQSKDYKHVCSF